MELPNWGEYMEDWAGLENYLHDNHLSHIQLLKYQHVEPKKHGGFLAGRGDNKSKNYE
jgi:hypothetical protein